MHCKKTSKDIFLCVRVLNHADIESTCIRYHITTFYSVPASLLSGDSYSSKNIQEKLGVAVNVNYHDEIK